MNRENTFYKCWKKELTEFSASLSVLRKKTDPDATHNIRVSIKKLRVWVTLYCLHVNDPAPLQKMETTESFFAVLGVQRDAENCLKLITCYEKENTQVYPGLKKQLKYQLVQSRNRSKKAIEKYDKKDLSSLTFLFKQEEPDGKARTIILQQFINQVAGIKKEYKQLHQLRRHLKMLYYWLLLMPDESDKSGFETDKLHAILESLGEWQDLGSTEKRVRHFRKDCLAGIHLSLAGDKAPAGTRQWI